MMFSKKYFSVILIPFFCALLGGVFVFADQVEFSSPKELQTQSLHLPSMEGVGKNILAQENSQALTLDDCYQLALKQSETIAIQKEVINEAEGRFLQSLNTVLPQASFIYSDKRQDVNDGSSTSLSRTPESKFTFSQPLFSGFKEFAAIKGSRSEKKQRQKEKIRAEQLLFINVSDAFYFLLDYQEDRGVLTTIQTALQQRVDELKKREELGRSRPSEVASAEARLSRLEADLEEVSGNEGVARELLEFLIGRPIEKIIEVPFDVTPQERREEDILKKAQIRADVAALEEAWHVAKKQLVIAQSGFWPAVNLEGNYYEKRVGTSEGNDWDATLKVSMPISGLESTVGKVKEVKAQENEARLRFEQAYRRAILEIKNAYTRLESTTKKLTAVEKSQSASERNYQLQTEDYRLSLVNNLDVLSALADLETARRDFIAAKIEMKRSYWNLQVALGEIPRDTR